MKRRAAVVQAGALVALAIIVAAAGCAGQERAGSTPTEPDAALDCAYPLVWNEVRYEAGIDLPSSARLGPKLGPGVVLGCGSEEMGYYPDENVSVRRIDGVDPAVAVAARIKDADRPIVWLGHGYLVESPRHPLHPTIATSWGLDGHQGFTCGASRKTRAYVLFDARSGQPLEVRADIPRLRPSHRAGPSVSSPSRPHGRLGARATACPTSSARRARAPSASATGTRTSRPGGTRLLIAGEHRRQELSPRSPLIHTSLPSGTPCARPRAESRQRAEVLIIEDDDVIAEGMSRHLTTAGFDPLWVNQGRVGPPALLRAAGRCVLDLMLRASTAGS